MHAHTQEDEAVSSSYRYPPGGKEIKVCVCARVLE